MGKVTTTLDERHRAFITAQKMFFVASAPGGTGGHVNCSPKGLDTFRIVDDATVAYLDFTGSGIETVAHVRDNGRLCVMFCAFDGSPMILRLHGEGDVVEPGDPEWRDLRAHFAGDPRAAERAIIRLRVARVAESCGFGVPLYDYRGEREQLTQWGDRKGESGVTEYQRAKNAASIDGLPGLAWVARRQARPR